MNQHVEITVGTPLIDPYGNHGFVAEIKAPETATYVLGAGMTRVRNEFVCVFDRSTAPISQLADGIAAPFAARAMAANLPTVPVADIPARMAAARQAQREAFDKAARERESANAARDAFRADARGKIPAWAKAFFVAELVEDQSDSMTDYFGSTTTRRVILGFSRHTRDLFPEMRQAARNFAETASLADAPESAEHREKWSMGAGYYLKSGSRHGDGWRVSKSKFYGTSEPAEQLPFPAEWSLATAEIEHVAAPAASVVSGMRIEEHTHTKKGFTMHICILPGRVEREEFDRLRDHAQSLGGWYSKPWAGTPGGFAFKRRDMAETFVGAVGNTAVERPATTAAPSPAIGDKLRAMADAMQSAIDDKFRDRLTNTPKRQREADSARLDGNRLQRTQAALRALAAAHDAGAVPDELIGVRTKAAVFDLMATEIDRSRAGYYDAGIDTGKPSKDSPAARALWSLVGAAASIDAKAEELRRKVQSLQFAKIPGFFPTPLPVVELMIYHAYMPAAPCRVLEPEAGSGAIADVVRERFKHASLTLYEPWLSLRDVLTLKGYTLSGSDFLDAEPSAEFDRVLMNPPFENGQEIDHVRHAFRFLKSGGRLVSVMSPGPFFRQDRKAASFRDWFESLGGKKIDMPAGSFKESGTGVGTVLIVLDAKG
jgi:hypothetical protein